MSDNGQASGTNKPDTKKRKVAVSKTRKRKGTPFPESDSPEAKQEIVDRELELLLRCAVCYETLQNPIYLVAPCSHRYCEGCIKQWRTVKNNCPTCKGPVGRLHRDLFAESMVTYFFKNNPNAEKSTPRAPWVDPPRPPPRAIPRQAFILTPLDGRATTVSDFFQVPMSVAEPLTGHTSREQNSRADNARSDEAIRAAQRRIMERVNSGQMRVRSVIQLSNVPGRDYQATIEELSAIAREMYTPESHSRQGSLVINENAGEPALARRVWVPEMAVGQAAPQVAEPLVAVPLPIPDIQPLQAAAPAPEPVTYQQAVEGLAGMATAPVRRRPHTRSRGPPL